MGIFNPPKPSHDKSPIWVWLDYLVKWCTSERVYIKGWNFVQKADGKYFIPPSIPPVCGWSWQTPYAELNPFHSVKANTAVLVSQDSAMVTQPFTDLVTGVVTPAIPGIYIAKKDVPPYKNVGGVLKYNVPVNPPYDAPSMGLIPGDASTNLPGDYDDDNIFWRPLFPITTPVQLFAITDISNSDYVRAVPINISYVAGVLNVGQSTSGSSLVKLYIAKANRQRPSVTSELIDGVTISYSGYTLDNTRIASDGTNTEYQVCFPRYTTAATLGFSLPSLYTGSAALIFLNSLCIIKAVQLNLGGVYCGGIGGAGIKDANSKPITWEEITTRVWARRYVQ
jgi:hypothetical protein